jgi:hypothetical protein
VVLGKDIGNEKSGVATWYYAFCMWPTPLLDHFQCVRSANRVDCYIQSGRATLAARPKLSTPARQGACYPDMIVRTNQAPHAAHTPKTRPRLLVRLVHCLKIQDWKVLRRTLHLVLDYSFDYGWTQQVTKVPSEGTRVTRRHVRISKGHTA